MSERLTPAGAKIVSGLTEFRDALEGSGMTQKWQESQRTERVVFVRCTFGPGDFPTDRKFTIKGFDRSTADENYCFATDRKTRIGVMASSRKSPSPGYVLGIVRGRMPDGATRVECPDGEIYHLWAEEFIPAGEQE